MVEDDWVAENFTLLSNDSRESSFGLEDQVIGNKYGDIYPEAIGLLIPPPNKENLIDEDKLPLRWFVQRQRGIKGKEKMAETGKKTKKYNT